ncbi:MAG: sialate O-acetylesterase [Ruminococcaceae bacterium]|jgi:sialate O-acetylesterase|nr:sialate O-acetylesterase [Oscillospiraceae bacterium]
MLSLPSIFSSGALFQADSLLTVHGRSDTGKSVRVTAVGPDGAVFSEAQALPDRDGSFSATIRTPAPSFDAWTIAVSDGEDERVMEDVLFGELWLSSGQSNMELTNLFIPDAEFLYDSVAEKQIRVFSVSYDVPENLFPWEPDEFHRGDWIGPDNRGGLAGVSAMGLKFAEQIYLGLNRGRDVPVGFLNASWGGTPITAWFPRDAILADEFMTGVMTRTGTIPDGEKWNTRGDCNFQQPTAQYNLKIAPLHGVKVRGVIWYQGENECGGEFWQKAYADYLRFYHKTYADRFAADPGDFYMISSLIYPWTYGPSGECNLGYLNDAFVTVAKEAPDKFISVPIGDLRPDWGYFLNNHPIHPTNKYPLAERTAKLALANVYEKRPEAPAFLESWEIRDGRVILSFSGGPVRIGNAPGERIRGLYVAGADNVYLPAECEVLSERELAAWCPEIPEPANAAYGIQSMEPMVNLYAGDYPVLPFFTDRETYINIEARPWYDPAVTSTWGSKLRGDVLDLFYRPVWKPLPGSEVCPDPAFRCEDDCSVRIEAEDGNGGVFGASVRSYPYQKLDLGKFRGMRVHLFNISGLTASLAVFTSDGEREFPFVKTSDLRGGWAVYEATFEGLTPETDVSRMEFRFEREGETFRFANLEHPRLLK